MRAKAHNLPNTPLDVILDPADPADKDYSATKIVGTIGPACQSADVLATMLEAGMSAARWAAVKATQGVCCWGVSRGCAAEGGGAMLCCSGGGGSLGRKGATRVLMRLRGPL